MIPIGDNGVATLFEIVICPKHTAVDGQAAAFLKIDSLRMVCLAGILILTAVDSHGCTFQIGPMENLRIVNDNSTALQFQDIAHHIAEMRFAGLAFAGICDNQIMILPNHAGIAAAIQIDGQHEITQPLNIRHIFSHIAKQLYGLARRGVFLNSRLNSRQQCVILLTVEFCSLIPIRPRDGGDAKCHDQRQRHCQ